MSGEILVGDNRVTLASLPARAVHCCISSPPYFGLRSYLPVGHESKALEIGSEQTPEEFIAVMVEVFREVRRVLRDDGTLWVNLGDSYSASPGQRKTTDKVGPKQLTNAGSNTTGSRSVDGMGGGQLMNMPHRVAEALRADGWVWRQTIVWQKKSPMPESIQGTSWRRCRVKVGQGTRADTKKSETSNGKPHAGYADDGKGFANDAKWSPCPGCPKCAATGGYVLRRGSGRCTTSFEYVFLFAKGPGYFFDLEAVKEVAVGGAPGNKSHRGADAYANGDEHHRKAAGLTQMVASETRIPRAVWTMAAEPMSLKHFASFPSELPKRCILAGTSPKCCAMCGAPYAPVVESERVATRPGENGKMQRTPHGWETGDVPHNAQAWMTPEGRAEVGNRDPQRHIAISKVTDYWPTCTCHTQETRPAIVLDPFGGTGRTAQAAHWLGRDWLLCELNPAYVDMVPLVIAEVPRFARQAKPAKKRKVKVRGQFELFPA